MLALCTYLQTVTNYNCTLLFGYSASLWGLFAFCLGAPALVCVGSIYAAYIGILSLKEGVYPPSNVPLPSMKPKRGIKAKTLAYFALIVPVVAVGTMGLGVYSFNEVIGPGSVAEAQQEIYSQCKQHVTS